MVNADKHKFLKVINSITAPERVLKQIENDKRFFNKNKDRVYSNCNFHQERFSRLENYYNRELKEL